MIFNERLKALRKANGLTQMQMAEKMSIAYRNYQRLEADGNTPNYVNLIKIADILDVSLDYLTGRTEQREINRYASKGPLTGSSNQEDDTMSNTITIGTVGTSSIMKLMQQAIAAVPGVRAQVVYSRDEDRGREFAQAAGVPEHCADYGAMLAREDIDAVYIASPNRFHLEQALQALARKKHVILEKPAAVRKEDAERLVQAAEENGVFLFEAISTLFMPNYLALKERLPRLGRVRRAEIAYGQYSSKYDAYLRGENPNIFNPEMEAGALNDMGIYCVHAAVDLFGPPETVEWQAERGPNGIDLAGQLTLGYRDFTCELRAAKNRDMDSGCRIEGERGWLRSDGPLNEFPAAQARLDGALEDFQLQQGLQNRLVFELARFRDAIWEKDWAFFQRMARQSIAAAAILEAAHTGQTRPALS